MQDQKKGKRKLHIAAEKIGYSKESNDQQDQKRIHFTLSNRCEDELLDVVVVTCCCAQPVSRMLATVLEWLTDFLTGAIMESRKAARSKAVASPPCSQDRNCTKYKCKSRIVSLQGAHLLLMQLLYINLNSLFVNIISPE